MLHGSRPFFAAGGTLAGDAPSYLYREADNELVGRLSAGDYCFLLECRQMGKSSLVSRAILRLKQAGIATVWIDLQRIGTNVGADQWYAAILNEFGKELGLTKDLFEFWEEHLLVGPLARLLSAIEQVVLVQEKRKIVVFVDEIDFVQSLSFSVDEYFAGIRDSFNRRPRDEEFARLSYCLVGSATPSQLIRNISITPFNIGHAIKLRDFRREDLSAYEPQFDMPKGQEKAILDRVHYWTGGHPFMVQCVCSELLDRPRPQQPNDVDEIVNELFLSSEARRQEPSLLDVSRRILEAKLPGIDPQEARSQMLATYLNVLQGKRVEFKESEWHFAALRLSGAVREQDGTLVPRNRIYARVFDEAWVESNLPDRERKRQRSAARKAALKTAIVAGIVVLAIGSVALYTNAMRLAAASEAEKARYEAYHASMIAIAQFAQDNFWEGVIYELAKTEGNPAQGWERRYWDYRTKRLPGDDGRVYDWRFSPFGDRIIARAADGIRILDSKTGAVTKKIGEPYQDMAAAFEVALNKIVEVKFGGGATCYDLESGSKLWTAETGSLHWRPNSMQSPDSRWISGRNSEPLWLLDTQSGEVVKPKHPEISKAFRAVFGSNGTAMVGFPNFGTTTNDFFVFDPWQDRVLQRYRSPLPLQSLLLDQHNGLIYAGASSGEVLVFDAKTGAMTQQDKISDKEVWRMNLSPQGDMLSVGTLSGISRVYAISSRRLVKKGDITGVTDVTFAPDNQTLLARYQNAYFVNINDIGGTAMKRPTGASCLHPDRNTLEVLTSSGVLYRYQLDQRLPEPTTFNVAEAVNATPPIQFASAERHSTFVWFQDSKGREFWWDFLSNKEHKTRPLTAPRPVLYGRPWRDGSLSGFGSDALAVYRIGLQGQQQEGLKATHAVYSSDSGRYAALASMRGHCVILDQSSGKTVETDVSVPYSIDGAEFHEDKGFFLASNNLGDFYKFDLKTGKVLLKGGRHSGTALCVTMSPDGTRIATGGDDKTVRVFDAKNGRLLTILRGHTDDIWIIKWIENGDTLVSIDQSNNIIRWRTTPWPD